MTNRAAARANLVNAVKRIVGALEAVKTYDEYRARLWGAANRLYNGGRDANFVSSFVRSIDVQLTEAWNQGADEVGVKPDEMTSDDMVILSTIIENENQFVERIAGDIAQAHDDEMTPEDFQKQFGSRVDLWSNRWKETVNRAHVQFGSKKRLKWNLGKTEQHCSTCQALNGIVAFGSEWEQARFHPQMPPNDLLECRGWLCDCSLTPTTERRTPKALDRLLEIAGTGNL